MPKLQLQKSASMVSQKSSGRQDYAPPVLSFYEKIEIQKKEILGAHKNQKGHDQHAIVKTSKMQNLMSMYKRSRPGNENRQ